MKKLLQIAGITLGLTLFAGGVSAGTTWYIDTLNEHTEEEKETLEGVYEEKSSHMGKVVYDELQGVIDTEKERISTEARAYLDTVVQEEAAERANVKTEAIRKHADKKIEELKRHIDQLAKGGDK